MSQPVKSIEKKNYICETCHKGLYKDETPFETVCSKFVLDPSSHDLKDFQKLGKS